MPKRYQDTSYERRRIIGNHCDVMTAVEEHSGFASFEYESEAFRELCGDLIVSGHTISLFNAVFAFKQYAPRKLNLLAHLYAFASVIAVVCILLARKHYTIDNSYHNDDMEKNALSQSCWSWIVPYFEKDAPPPHLFLNRLAWPSSCPQRIRRRWA
uniref:Sphingomyelin synthase-like domain-containing protein n=1 Tax=Parascaris equorum TaxID=6256 RepID=A0A914RE31_PAREQ